MTDEPDAHGPADTADTQGQDRWAAVPRVADISGTRAAPQPVAGQAQRPRRRLGRRAVVGLVAGGAAVVLLLVAGVVGWSVGTDAHSADRPVRAFLDDLSGGRVDSALRDAGIQHGRSDVLLTDAAYAKVKDRVTGYRITGVQRDGDTATVGAYLTQAGRQVPATFTLDQTGTDWGVFPVWTLQAPRLGAVEVAVQGPPKATVTVSGQRTTTSASGTATLKALPGSYEVGVDGGTWFTADAQTATVRGFGDTASSPVTLTTALTEAGQQAATQAVEAWVDGCIASTSTTPDGCSFYAYGENPANTYTNQKWTLDARPTVSVAGWETKGWLVTTSSYGSATYTADFTGPAGSGTATAGPINVNASGYVTGFSDSGATFVSAVGNGSSDSGS
ncbi:hypothetical protein [Curtobacterium sp. MCBA15_001]|uniref:hypothetical protein n=1 Tax=Curtobacterium sp. MCBA15_001 TaxID=1898731 RepID=UPI0008DCB700|nr:hypothetical protein [Curtobacterium sp. MCBA15_001]OIH95372.1 hypothetical protein BIU90_01295 [Curtobacterium sp. MCBA15_001]